MELQVDHQDIECQTVVEGDNYEYARLFELLHAGQYSDDDEETGEGQYGDEDNIDVVPADV